MEKGGIGADMFVEDPASPQEARTARDQLPSHTEILFWVLKSIPNTAGAALMPASPHPGRRTEQGLVLADTRALECGERI